MAAPASGFNAKGPAHLVPAGDARARRQPLLTVHDVGRIYHPARRHDVVALDGVSLEVGDGEIVSLIGPSGCGKSTLLRLIAGLDTPSSGSIGWDRTPVPGKDIGFVFQEPALLPWRSIKRNVAFGLEVQKDRLGRDEIDDRVAGLLDLVGLRDFARSLPRELSGGMRQRAAIARALAYDPQILLMDEPFGALDAITRDRLNDDLLRIWERTQKTIILVTHSVDEAAYLSDRVVVMSSRPGRIRTEHDVPLPRDRDAAIRRTPEFADFTGMLRSELE